MVLNQTPTSQQINLMGGTFIAGEARTILIGLIDKKIQLHRTRRMNAIINSNYSTAAIEKERIEELQAEKLKIYHLFFSMKDDQQLEVQGQLLLELAR